MSDIIPALAIIMHAQLKILNVSSYKQQCKISFYDMAASQSSTCPPHPFFFSIFSPESINFQI